MNARITTTLMAALWTLAIGVGGINAYATEPTHDFTPYKIILEREPFGPMNGAAADAPPPGFSTRYTFVGTAQVAEDQPVLAIIVDKEGNRVYFKGEGDSLGSASVVKIERPDKAPAKLVLKQGLETATLLLEPKAGGAASPASPAPAGQSGQPGLPLPPVTIQPGTRRIPFHRG